MKKLFFLVILSLISVLNAQNKVLTSEYESELENAYRNKSIKNLESFLSKWNKKIEQDFITNLYPNETIKNVYEIYYEFYKPYDLLKLGDWEWGNNLNSKSKYALIQNKIIFYIFDSENISENDEEINENKTFKKDSIINFHPKVNLNKNQVLYLTTEHKKALNNFLGTESTKFGKPTIMSVSRPKKQSEKRYNFIRPYLPILHGHWGGYWNIETSPTIYRLELNKDSTQAKIYFSVGYQGGESLLEKENGIWKIKESKTTWIE